MKVTLAKSAGFCFGVKRAIDIALQTAASGKEIYALGDIVHNEDVAREIAKAGIKKIKKLFKGKNKILLIRAHGIGLTALKKAKQLGYKIIDATCPMVREIHKIAKEMEKAGYKIIVIGDKVHDEVKGIVGQLRQKAIVIDNLKMIPLSKIRKIEKAAVVVQSTQNLIKVLEILKVLKRHIKEVRFFNTICRPTTIKQEEMKKMPKENDVMIIIGSKTSANTKRLYEISKSLNERSYRVSSKGEIRPYWFKGAKCAGITAGASTPEATIKNIVRYLSSL
ncbi:MAG: 4-hydroxy-3-methylbut-2-enyl diphosphate reductase [Candidatus Omnitrophota bacterium]